MSRCVLLLAFLLLLSINIVNSMNADNKEDKKPKGDESLGVVLLDSWTFPIIVNKFTVHGTFILSMNKRDIGDYGSESLRLDFYQLAVDFLKMVDEEDTHKLLFAQVLVNGAINGNLGNKLGLTSSTKGVCVI